MRDLVKSGVLGERLFFEGKYMYGRWNKIEHGWRGQLKDYSVILGGLIHLIDLVCFITNDFNYLSVNNRHRITTKKPYDFKDIGTTVMASDQSGVALLSTVFSSPTEHRRDFSVYGDSGWIEVRGNLVSSGGNIESDTIKQLSAYPANKAQLLMEFINALSEQNYSHSNYTFPDVSQTIALIRLCLD